MTAPVLEASCRSILPDGSMLTITATRRPRAGRADVKCSVPGAPAQAERMQQVVRLARHTEPRYDSRDQVVLSADRALDAATRDWELAAVLADDAAAKQMHHQRQQQKGEPRGERPHQPGANAQP